MVRMQRQFAAARQRIVTEGRDRCVVELVLREGRKREIRRMFDALDVPVTSLVRVRIGTISDPVNVAARPRVSTIPYWR